eukprot:gene17528-23090_t
MSKISDITYNSLIPIGAKNFWNIRSSFYVLGGLLDVGTQMSIIKLSTGKFIVLDTVLIDQALKSEINDLTENGSLIEAVIATHPFHTVYFETFYKLYPDAKYYGTPRHLRNIKAVPWAGSVEDPRFLTSYENEGIFLRITAGTEFNTPDEDNHFASVFVFHQPSRTIHNDDTLTYISNPGCLLRCLGTRHDTLIFHKPSWKNELSSTPEAPIEFKEFIERILNDWDFDNIVAAHIGIKVGGAKEKLRKLINKVTPDLVKLADSRKAKGK